ncbi:DUF1850 domain-containing protein [Chelatococcus sp. GCM10030263]|uniref:DUF1850 domain-containing protein n=1 Tax=Chelatococcus sp. GCM10030263 TaxID=3273387 RepID=UPI003614A0E3
MNLCLAAASLVVHLGTSSMTLAWTHSVQKTVWEEDWRATAKGLVLDEARVQGSGAGMDPPPDARFTRGVWAWTPHLPPLPEVVLRRSGATADWRVCTSAPIGEAGASAPSMAGSVRACRPMSTLVPADADPVRLILCPTGPEPAAPGGAPRR